MSGGPLAHASSLLSYIYDNDDSNSLWWNDYGGSSHMDSNTYYNNYRKTADYNSIPFNAGSIGMVHDQGFKINAPTSVSVEFKAGTADQDASNMLVDILGEKGRHSRFAIGTNSLPLNMAVEIDAIVSLIK